MEISQELDGLLSLRLNRRVTLLELNIDKAEVPSIIEVLQTEARKATNSYRRKVCNTYLRVLVRRYPGILPSSLIVDNITRYGDHPLRGGGFADIWKARAEEEDVCLKVFRIHIENSEKARQKIIRDFCREALLWQPLSYVLPFLGVNMKLFNPGFCLISPWMDKGDIISYLKEHPKHDKLKAIYEISSGLADLHCRDILHGDLKGANILVDDQLHCRLADFGLSTSAGVSILSASTSSKALPGSLRWMAPESFTSSHNDHPFRSDIYSLGCTILEIVTGEPPFAELKNAVIILKVIVGDRPHRPTNVWCPDPVWELVETTWAQTPSDRPSAESMKALLEHLLALSKTEEALLSPSYLQPLDFIPQIEVTSDSDGNAESTPHRKSTSAKPPKKAMHIELVPPFKARTSDSESPKPPIDATPFRENTPELVSPSTSESQTMTSGTSPEPDSEPEKVEPPNPFFGEEKVQIESTIKLLEDFDPFKANKVRDYHSIGIMWPYTGQQYKEVFRLPEQGHPHPTHVDVL